MVDPRRDARYDFIIVGGGPAGCVLAARLSEASDCNVLLIEAGPDYGANMALWPQDILDPASIRPDSHPWGYRTAEPSDFEPFELPRGRVLGGSSAINGCVWLRGSRADYDSWRETGNPGWGFDELLPYFRQSESDPIAGSGLHGDGGPVPVWRAGNGDITPVNSALIATAEELGFDRVADLNGTEDQRPSVGPAPKNLKGGMRMNAALTYVAMARDRSNLHVVPDTLIDRVTFEDDTATGVLDVHGRVFEAEEVILSSGAYGSPAILLRSGIGPVDHLRDMGIDVVLNLPGVGEHLMDHPLVPGRFLAFVIQTAGAQGHASFLEVIVKARSHQVAEEIDLHLYPVEGYSDDRNAWTVEFSVSLQYSRSRGRVRLSSADPEATLSVDHGYFENSADLEALCDGVDIVEHMTSTPPLSTLLKATDDNVLRLGSRDERREWIRAHVGTTYHPSSTCRMGPASDPMAVVDGSGRVHGIRNLRVVDASIFPWGPRCNLHFPVVAAAEKIAEDIRSERIYEPGVHSMSRSSG